MVRGEAVQRGANADRKIKRLSRELNQTVNTVYFIVGRISRRDLWSQGIGHEEKSSNVSKITTRKNLVPNGSHGSMV